ncbi:hypothetical protein BMF89_01945 [Arthrobacter sp. SRS-W-1-2016]|uniref:S-layer homology domain-containing protein n=1 Tax=Arthrobacter sp. SRS-W-1-2016 TaxID=1930254 RepID=UPI0009913F99|nr:S-layer homology domain-containing protein [Arthrobacter sp. SRS-W-1-2016]OOP64919.1 hypothetical protein BMF89_01945 [Arthrobacter sp. SRS-W-1-2016]
MTSPTRRRTENAVVTSRALIPFSRLAALALPTLLVLGLNLSVPTAAFASEHAATAASTTADSNPSPDRHGAQVPAQLKGHRHAPVCGTAQPGRAACNSVVDLDVSGQVSPDISPYGYAPADLQSAYGLPGGAAGTGKTVAVVDSYNDPNAESDLGLYRSKYGLPACTTANGCFRKVDQRGGTNYPAMDQGWAQEISLDLDMVSAACPGCNILLVETDSTYMDDLGRGVNTAVSLGANAVSNSYGNSEYNSEPAYDKAYYNHPGIPITVSTGDAGYNFGPEYPATSPDVIAVGGTSLVQNPDTGVWTESAWHAGGSGCSAYETKPVWERDPGCSSRTEADIAAVADPSTGVSIYDSIPDQNGLNGWEVIGGTSAAAPIIAAAYALTGKPTTDYPAKLPYTAPTGLFDPGNGSNGTCSIAYLCNAQTGYDGPTGTGTLRGLRAIAPRQCNFTDVLVVDPFSSDMCWMSSVGISTGYPDGTYKATTPVARDAMAAFMYRLKGSPAYTPPTTSPFTDVAPTDPFYKEISWLSTNGIATGYPDGTYRPLDSVHRDAMAAFLYRLAGSPSYAPPATSAFTDVATTDPFYKEISWLASTGISTGYPDGTFRPGSPVNRDAMAAFMHRYSNAFPNN